MSEVYVQVVPNPSQAGQLGGPPVVERLKERVGELTQSIGAIATDLWSQLDSALALPQSTAWSLDELELKFALDLEAQAGVVVARAATTASFEVTLTWQRQGHG
jgi:hypothetical protein